MKLLLSLFLVLLSLYSCASGTTVGNGFRAKSKEENQIDSHKNEMSKEDICIKTKKGKKIKIKEDDKEVEYCQIEDKKILLKDIE